MPDYERYLFRGKEKDSGKWIYGDLRHISDGHGGYILCIVDNTNGRNNDVTGFKVIPETVGQYTGLTDKNDVKIFEGDIVRYDANYHDMVISYDVENWGGWLYEDMDDNMQAYSIYEFNLKDIAVIGNIYDSPALLGKAAKDIAADAVQGGLAPATENFELMGG